MYQKPLLLATAFIALLVIGGAFWFMQQRQGAMNQLVVTEPVAQAPIRAEAEKYPQHIESIPGNTDEVWYDIPELGVRMKLNKEFAEDLVYSDGMIDDYGSHREGIYFSTKAISEVAPECAPRRGGAFGVLERLEGKGAVGEDDGNKPELGFHQSEFGGQLIFQFPGYFIQWTTPQAGCWYLEHEDSISKIHKEYSNAGATSIREGLKTIEKENVQLK